MHISRHPAAIALFAIFSLCGILGCGSKASAPHNPPSENPGPIVRLDQTTECSGVGGRLVTCYMLTVEEVGIGTRGVAVRAYQQTGSSGAALLGVGGYGTTFYSNYGPEAVETIETLYGLGLEVFEIKWEGDQGWADGYAGLGYARAVMGYSTVVQWLYDNVMDNPDLIYAQGNSGGSIQIAFGLAMYGLEQYIDVAILSGGPPVSDLRRGIFGDLADEARWPDGLAGLSVTDLLMGWEDNGDYCVARSASDSILTLIDDASLVSPTEQRLLSYSTMVHFVESDDETNADHQGAIYFDAITSAKEWHFISSTTEHRVPSTQEGASLIRSIIETDLTER